MPESYLLYYISIFLATAFSAVLAVSIIRFAGKQPENKAMMVFLCMVSVWSMGQLLLAVPGDVAAMLGKAFINAMPLLGVSYLHLCLAQTKRGNPHLWRAAYAVAAFISLVAIIDGTGQVEPWLEFERYYSTKQQPWMPVVTGMMFFAGLVLLWTSRHTAKMVLNRQATAMFYASSLGAVGFFGFLFPTMSFRLFPFPVFVWAAFPVLLAYGSFRYSTIRVNTVAEKIMGWLLLAGSGFLVYVVMLVVVALLGFDTNAGLRWALLFFVAPPVIFAYIKPEPFFALAGKVIYFKNPLTSHQVEQWCTHLDSAKDVDQLRATAQDLISDYLGQFVGVQIATIQPYNIISLPRVLFYKHAGVWAFDLEGWQFANPAYTRGGEMLANLVADKLNTLLPGAQWQSPVKKKRQPQVTPGATQWSIDQDRLNSAGGYEPPMPDHKPDVVVPPTPVQQGEPPAVHASVNEAAKVDSAHTGIPSTANEPVEEINSVSTTEPVEGINEPEPDSIHIHHGGLDLAVPPESEPEPRTEQKIEPEPIISDTSEHDSNHASVHSEQAIPRDEALPDTGEDHGSEPIIKSMGPKIAPVVTHGDDIAATTDDVDEGAQALPPLLTDAPAAINDKVKFQYLFNQVDRIMGHIKRQRELDAETLQAVGLTASDIEPYKSPLELDYDTLNILNWLEKIIESYKGQDVKIRNGEPATMLADSDELKHALTELFGLFNPFSIVVDVINRTTELMIISEITAVIFDSEHARQKDFFSHDVLTLLSIYYIVHNHGGSMRFIVSEQHAFIEMHFPWLKAADAE